MNYNKSKQKKQTVRKKMNSTTAAAVGTKTSTDRKTKKFKIVERKKLDPALPDYNEFRLFDFQHSTIELMWGKPMTGLLLRL